MELNYDKLLDDWAEELFRLADEYECKKDHSPIGSFEYGYYKGMHEATVMAISKLTLLEKRKSQKYKKDQLTVQ